MTEQEIDRLCAEFGLDVAGRLGLAMSSIPHGPDRAYLAHIVAMSGMGTLLGQAARLCVEAELGIADVAHDDPVVCALIQGWGQALRFYPDQSAIQEAMTEWREEIIASRRGLDLLEQIARCRDPGQSDDADAGDAIETLSKIIRGAKSIVGDLEEKEDDENSGIGAPLVREAKDND